MVMIMNVVWCMDGVVDCDIRVCAIEIFISNNVFRGIRNKSKAILFLPETCYFGY